jgi:hypothetical protein
VVVVQVHHQTKLQYQALLTEAVAVAVWVIEQLQDRQAQVVQV